METCIRNINKVGSIINDMLVIILIIVALFTNTLKPGISTFVKKKVNDLSPKLMVQY